MAYREEVRERAVREVLEQREESASEWAAIRRVAQKFGVGQETLRRWVRKATVDEASRPGGSTAEARRIKELLRENRELRRTIEILKAAAAVFARELDPQPRR